MKAEKCFCGFAYDADKWDQCPQVGNHGKPSNLRCFAIYTEDKNPEWIENILSIGFDGFTIVRGVGYWRGQKEKSLKVEIYTDNVILLKAVAEKIKHHNKQETVLISETQCEVTLL